MIDTWTCTVINASTTDCAVTGTTTIAAATSTPILSHDEALFIVMVLILILSIPFFRFIFSGWTK